MKNKSELVGRSLPGGTWPTRLVKNQWAIIDFSLFHAGRRKIEGMISIQPLLVAVVLLTSTTGCSSPTSQDSQASYSLHVGETVEPGNGELALTFEKVENDSRCPKDVLCVMAGQADVVFTVRSNSEERTLIFEVPPDGSDTDRYGNYTITVESLEPQTQSGETIEQDEYIISIQVQW